VSNVPGPGLQNQAGARTAARVVAVVLLLLGVVLLVRGISGFLDQASSPSMEDDGFGSILTIGAGGFCIVFGLAAANVGWLRAQASYVAGETMPVVKDSAAYLSDGRGVAGVGRTKDDASPAAGPYCRACGTRNDEVAKFCDSCGQSLA
jgi:hypothetical protein